MRNLLFALLLPVLTSDALAFDQGRQQASVVQSPGIETTYDRSKDRTAVRLAPVRISGEKDKYYSLHFTASFSYPGHSLVRPEFIDFELQTVVKTKLRIDLYVVFIVDGETTFLSSSRWGVKRPVPGRRWMGERLVFRMPYEMLMKITRAKNVVVKMDAVEFELGEEQLQMLRGFAMQIQ